MQARLEALQEAQQDGGAHYRFVAGVRTVADDASVGDDATVANQPISPRTTPEWAPQLARRRRTPITIAFGLIGVVVVTVFTWVWRGPTWPTSA